MIMNQTYELFSTLKYRLHELEFEKGGIFYMAQENGILSQINFIINRICENCRIQRSAEGFCCLHCMHYYNTAINQ